MIQRLSALALTARHSRLLRATLWAIVGNLVALVTQAATVLVLVRLGGDLAAGRYALALAVTAPVILVFAAQLRVVLATDATRRDSFTTYLTLRVLAMGAAIAVVGLVVIWRRDPAATATVILLVGALKVVEALSDTALGAFQLHERIDRYARSQVLRAILLFVAVLVLVGVAGSLATALLVALVAWIGVLAVHDLPAVRAITGATTRPQIGMLGSPSGRGRLARLASNAAPLGLVSMLIALRQGIPTYVLDAKYGTAAVGVFTAVAYFTTLGVALVVATGQALMPRLAVYAVSDRAAFQRLFVALLAGSAAIGVAGVLGAFVLGGPILRLLYGARYEAQADLLMILMLGGAIGNLNSAVGVGLTACRAFRVQVPVLVLALAVGIGAAVLLIPGQREIGAAWSVVVSGLVWLLANGVILARLVARLPSRRRQVI